MSFTDFNPKWLPNYFNDQQSPKILYKVSYEIPENVFQNGFDVDLNIDFNFFDYYFNVYQANNNSKNFISAYETINEALINFRKDLNFNNNLEIKDFYLYSIRPDENFYSKNLTRNSISFLIYDKILKIKKQENEDKLIFAFNYYGDKYSNHLEWFTTNSIANNQIISAWEIKIDFKNKLKKDLDSIIATPNNLINEFRNPNYVYYLTSCNNKTYFNPENFKSVLEFKNKVYYFPELFCNEIGIDKSPYLKSFKCENLLDKNLYKNFLKNNWISNDCINKSFVYVNRKTNKKQKIISNFYKEDINLIYKNVKENKINNVFLDLEKHNIFFNYESSSKKTVFLNVNNNANNNKTLYLLNKNFCKKKEIQKWIFDNLGRFIYKNKNEIPLAITIIEFNKNKDLCTLELKPAVLNDINQLFHFEHQFSGLFYLKSNNPLFNHLDLAIRHKDNSLVFLNTSKKYEFSYDILNLNINNYKQKHKTFIYGCDSNIYSYFNLNLKWFFNKNFYKPNIFVSKNGKENLEIEQARSTKTKKNNYHFLYNFNNLQIVYFDFNYYAKNKKKLYIMKNNVDSFEKFRWLTWSLNNSTSWNTKNSMWFLKKAKYDQENYYWIISYFNNDYLWCQQKGFNWGFLFLAQKNSAPLKSTSLFLLNKMNIK